MINRNDKVRHKEKGYTGIAISDEMDNGTVSVKQDDGGIATWVAADVEVIEAASSD